MSSPLPAFSIREVPFSRRGSWLNLSPVVGLHTVAEDIHLVTHVTGMHSVLRLVPTRAGASLRASVGSDPSQLTWSIDGLTVARAAFESGSILRVVGHGTDFTISDAAGKLTPFSGSYFIEDPVDGSHVFTSYESGRRYRVTLLRGAATARGAEELGERTREVTISGADGWEVAIEEFESSRAPYAMSEEFDNVVRGVDSEFRQFADAIAPWRTEATPAASLAAYVLWAAAVEPAGFIGRETVLMSKHWMDKVWSWDHAFNALALAPGLPGLALDQFLAPFDHQDASGAMPDSVTHSEVLYNFVKPPVHGWAFQKLRSRLSEDFGREQLRDVHDRLAGWSRFWMDFRTVPGHDLPHYQHGNDSGWDNSTMFDSDRVVEAPDLAVMLILQLGVLADLADELDGDGSHWRAARSRIQGALLDKLKDDEGFFAVGALTGRISKRTSLLNLLPILIADDLSQSTAEQLAGAIEDHLTRWGPATQLVDSPEYDPDGYWRGPIWAPSTMLIEDGLRRAGFIELADQVSDRFRALCEASGFAENFDAVSGAGLRDRAYTWTASVYLVLAGEWIARQKTEA